MSLIYKKIHLFLSMCLPVCACTHVRLEVLCRYPGTGVTWAMEIELQSSDGAVSTLTVEPPLQTASQLLTHGV